jgi:hypothetical protein
MAGAEIFDGMTWITHAYDPDLWLATYPDAFAVRHDNWTQHERRRHSDLWANNLAVRDRVTLKMKEYLVDGEIGLLGPQSERIRQAIVALRSRIGGEV